MTSSWVFLSTLNYDARSTTYQINLNWVDQQPTRYKSRNNEDGTECSVANIQGVRSMRSLEWEWSANLDRHKERLGRRLCLANEVMLSLCEVRESRSCAAEEPRLMGHYKISVDIHVITFRMILMPSSVHSVSECLLNTAVRISDFEGQTVQKRIFLASFTLRLRTLLSWLTLSLHGVISQKLWILC